MVADRAQSPTTVVRVSIVSLGDIIFALAYVLDVASNRAGSCSLTPANDGSPPCSSRCW